MIRHTLTGAAVALALATGATGVQAAPVAICHEDMSCWNWRTMGNHSRAITTLAGRTLVVRPAKFDALNRAFRIDWSATRKLRGDRIRYDVQTH